MLISMPRSTPGMANVYTTFWGATAPTNTDVATTFTNYGMRYQFAVAGRIVGLRYAREKRTSGVVIGQVFDDATRTLQRVCMFRVKSAAGTGFDRWEHAYFRPWYPVAANGIVRVAVWFSSARPMNNNGGLVAADVTHGNIKALKDAAVPNRNDAISLDCGICPTTSDGGDLFGIDVLYLED